jgi:uncharacterized protein YecT (DUF1311 family)
MLKALAAVTGATIVFGAIAWIAVEEARCQEAIDRSVDSMVAGGMTLEQAEARAKELVHMLRHDYGESCSTIREMVKNLL